jgi:hypothetical protein
MSLGQKRRQSPLKPDEFPAACQPERIARRIRHDKRRNASSGGASTEDRCALIRLQKELAQLKEQVAALQNLVDPDEIAAARRLHERPLTNDQLRVWSESQIIPEEVAKAVEERPW